ncbi:MAG: SMC-Scp complex subunit ScpB [Rhodanobacteraceae bacterium]|nr:SMC-Scp complex subunit ScpB [Rhodanobacteraceae bacterium]
MDQQLLKRVIEAILLAAAQPLSLAQLAALFTEEEDVDNDQLLAALATLAEDCAQRGIELKEVASGYRYQIREDVHSWVTRLWTERQTKYSRALLETLALIAYRQPITRAEIEQIRGVAVSSSIIKTLEEREWVRVVGYRDVPGRPALFGTSRGFLDYFNLRSLDELPPLAEIRDLDEYDPQLDLAPVIPPSPDLPPDDSEVADITQAMLITGAEVAANPASVEATGDTRSAESAEPLPGAEDLMADEEATADPNTGAGNDVSAGTFDDISTPAEFSPDDDNVGPNDTTTSDDVPEHIA